MLLPELRDMNEYSLQQALLSQQTLSRFPLMNGMPGAMPWFPQPPAPRPHDIATATTNLPPFQVSEFIKHAAQQQLQAQLKQHDQSSIMSRATFTSDGNNVGQKGEKRQMLSEVTELPDTPNGKKRRGNYASYTPQQRIEIGAYSIECGTGKASKHFGLPESTARGFRDKLIKLIQDSNEPIPLEADRLARLKILLESGTAQGNAAVVYQETNVKSEISDYPWIPKSDDTDLNKNQLSVIKPIFQPHLDFINSSKSSEEELNVTKSSASDFSSKRIEELNSDEDSGHSSANSSGNEESKKITLLHEESQVLEKTAFNQSLLIMREKILNQFTQSMTCPNQDRRRGQFGRYNQQFKLEVAQFAIKEGNSAACRYFNLPESTVRHFKQLVLRKRSADDSFDSIDTPLTKVRKDEPTASQQTTSSPNQKTESNTATNKNLDQFKLSKNELERRKQLHKSRNAEMARGEMLQRDHNRPPTQIEIDTELKRLQALRAALYERENMDQIIRNADEKIESVVTEGTGFEGAVRVAGHVAITSAPSDISSIHGHDEERDCSTPNSCSSSESQNLKKITPNISINSEPNSTISTQQPVEDISHTEANGLLEQVESALDKVTGSVTQRPSSFTARLLGTLTQTVKFVADCETRLLEESGIRMQLSMQVEQQKKIIDALSRELMGFDTRQKRLEDQMVHLIDQKQISSNADHPIRSREDPVLQNVTQLVNLLRQPGALPSAHPSVNPNIVEDNLPMSFSDLADALGDQMTQNN